MEILRTQAPPCFMVLIFTRDPLWPGRGLCHPLWRRTIHYACKGGWEIQFLSGEPFNSNKSALQNGAQMWGGGGQLNIFALLPSGSGFRSEYLSCEGDSDGKTFSGTSV